MIKYLELTAPESSEFRQCKIVSIEVSEGDTVSIGDPLFKILSGKKEIDLPSKLDGKVIEIIAIEGESISLMTPLVLLETEVESSTATPPMIDEANTEPEGKQLESKKQPASNEIKEQPEPEKQPELEKQPEPKNEKQPEPKKQSEPTKKPESIINTDIQQQQLNLDSQAYTEQNISPDLTPEPAPKSKTKVSEKMSQSTVSISVPDIGGDSAKVIEILVNVGDKVAVEDPLITLESDKASMDVPSTHDGIVSAIIVEIDQDVSEGTVIVELEAPESEAEASTPETAPAEPVSTESAPATTDQTSEIQQTVTTAEKPIVSPAAPSDIKPVNTGASHASPSVRRFARELGVDLSKVSGSGRKNRIIKQDVTSFVKGVMTSPASGTQAATSGAGIPTIPAQDFSKFGEIDIQPLNKIKRATAENLHRSWLNVPHVTHSDEADISDLEQFRKQLNVEYKQQDRGIKLSPLAFIVKAVVNALRKYPQFNSSLEPSGENLIYKKFFNIGIAVETPNGLVVPVIRDADKLSVAEIATTMGELAKKARDKKLTMKDMSGACFTISSLGGIGGTHFTPIVNAPEVAILGVSRSKIQPVWNGSEFEPGDILPLSLSYDHRVIDGAEAARFTRHIAAVLADVRRLTV